MTTLAGVPDWVLRPLPVDAVADAALHARIDEVARDLPANLPHLGRLLEDVRPFREYDAGANRACGHVWRALDRCLGAPHVADRLALLEFAEQHFPPAGLARLLRRLVKDQVVRVRRHAQRVLRMSRIREVALPLKDGGDWDQTGWVRGASARPLSRHPQGRRVLQRLGLPV